MEQTTRLAGNNEFWTPPETDRPAMRIGLNLFGGVVLPLVCLVADPVVFRSGVGGGALFPSVRVAAYSFFALQMTALILCLCRPRLHRRAAAILAGVMFVGSAAALLLGIMLLPFSLIGLMAVIGILGFSPLLVSWIYYKNAVRAYRAARSEDLASGQQIDERRPHLTPRYALCWAAGILSVVIPYGVQSFSSEMTASVMKAALDGDDVASAAAFKQMSDWKLFFRFFADTDRLAEESLQASTDQRFERIARLYSIITDEDMEQRLAILRD